MIDYRIGDTRDVIATLADGSVSLVATSPPFLALRSYLPADHEHKHAEIGSEPDPATFIDTLLALTADWGRVLAPWGSIAIELGDTYSGGSAQGTDQGGSERYPNGRGMALLTHNKNEGVWPLAKSLALIPQLYAIALAYGINPLTGQPSPAGRWRVRNVIVWHRPNPAVGALGDKVRPSTSYIVIATRSAKRWFDLTAVRGGHARDYSKEKPGGETEFNRRFGLPMNSTIVADPAGAPPLDAWFDEYDGHDTWTVTTQPSRLAHYAMWPARLAERLVLSMCPLEVCVACGEPRRRVETAEYVPHGDAGRQNAEARAQRGATEVGVNGSAQQFTHGRATKIPTTAGWTDCQCGAGFTPGVVLDPFAGTFTTGLVAEFHGRNAIGIDVDARNADLVPQRREEVRRNLNPTHVRSMAGQTTLFDEGLQMSGTP